MKAYLKKNTRSMVVSVVLMAIGVLLANITGCGGGGGGSSQPSSQCGSNDVSVVLCVGDSITRGVNGVTPYPSILGTMLPENRIINSGVSDEETTGGARRIQSLMGNKPCYVLILYGANDAIHGVSAAVVVSNLRYIIQTVKNNGSIPIIGTLTPQIWSHAVYQGTVNHFNVAIRDLASEENIKCADLAQEFSGNEANLLLADGLHLNSDGARVVAMTFYEAIK